MRKGKVIGITTLIVILLLAGFCYVKFCFVFGEGVKAGELNQLVYKGYVFKTFEGRLIQSGYRGSKASVIQSYQFDFSVTNDVLADSLMRCSGKVVELHYKEYLGALPWRGVQKYIVDRIVSVHDGSSSDSAF